MLREDRLSLLRARGRVVQRKPRHLRADSPRPAIEAALREVPRRSDRAIARSLKCDNTTVSAVRRSLGIPAGPKDRTKRERNAALAEMARTTKATYAEIGWRFGLDKTRANQIALAYGVRRAA